MAAVGTRSPQLTPRADIFMFSNKAVEVYCSLPPQEKEEPPLSLWDSMG
uniref:Uncharacterized protein n=1 Tax=Tetraselmis sp. GSL018 TaxID=582737 RepID=A0A061S3J7_9CHLO